MGTLETGKFIFSKFHVIKFINIFLWLLLCIFLKKVSLKVKIDIYFSNSIAFVYVGIICITISFLC